MVKFKQIIRKTENRIKKKREVGIKKNTDRQTYNVSYIANVQWPLKEIEKKRYEKY